MNNSEKDPQIDRSQMLKQARTILTFGRLIHARAMKVHAQCLTKGIKGPSCGELTLPQMKTIMAIHAMNQATVKELSEILGVSPPSTSAMVDRLVELGVLTRQQDPDDRRKVIIRTSPKIKEHIEEVEDLLLESFIQIVEKIGPEKAQQWCDIVTLVGQVVLEEDKSLSQIC